MVIAKDNFMNASRCLTLLALCLLASSLTAQEVSEAESVPEVLPLELPLAELATDPVSEPEPETGPMPLSVAPLDHVEYQVAPPQWISESPQLDGEVAVWPVRSQLCDSEEEAKYSLQIQVQGAVAAYAEHFLGDERARVLGNDVALSVDLDSLPESDRFIGTAQRGGQTYHEQAVRLRFDEKYRKRLASAWQEREVEQRLSVVGLASGAGLLVLIAGTGIVRRVAKNKSVPTV
jgi:hypothetical protein